MPPNYAFERPVMPHTWAHGQRATHLAPSARLNALRPAAQRERQKALMSRRVPQVGTPYYRLTWSDPDFTIAGVEPFIFIGINIGDDDMPVRPQYYFRDTLSHSWCGSAADPGAMRHHEDIEPHLVSCSEDELESGFHTLDQVVDQLCSAQRRVKARSSGE